MDCRRIQERLLAEYPDKELGALEHAEVEGHLAACGGCREFYGVLQKAAIAPFKEAQEIQPEEIVWRRIQEKLGAEKRSGANWFGRLADLVVPVLRIPQPAFRMAFATALVLGVVVLAQWPSANVDPAYGYLSEQMTFMSELESGNPELLSGELKGYDTALEEISR